MFTASCFTHHTIHTHTHTHMEPDTRLSKQALGKLRRRLQSGPRNSKLNQTAGFIYVYALPDDAPFTYFKVGRTEQPLKERMKQWSKTHGCTVELMASFGVDRNLAWCERLIHLYLDYCRMYRYPVDADDGKITYYNVWKTTGKPVTPFATGEPARVAKNKHTEWFNESLSVISNVCIAVTARADWPQ